MKNIIKKCRKWVCREKKLVSCMEYIENGKQEKKIKYSIEEILVIVLFVTSANADDWVEREMFLESHK